MFSSIPKPPFRQNMTDKFSLYMTYSSQTMNQCTFLNRGKVNSSTSQLRLLRS